MTQHQGAPPGFGEDFVGSTTESETSGQSSGLLPNRKSLRPQILVGVLCALLGYALVAQVRISDANPFATMRQEDLVRLLEDVTLRGNQLDDELARLAATRLELLTTGDQAEAALEHARQRAAVEGILSGRLPAQGPGVTIEIDDPTATLTAMHFVNLLEELRNAGAEAVQVDNYRIVTSSAFTDMSEQVSIDGNVLPRHQTWVVIGNPATIARALEIPGGAFPQIRRSGGIVELVEVEQVYITATATLRTPQWAQALPVE